MSDRYAIEYAVGALSVLALKADGELKDKLNEIVERLKLKPSEITEMKAAPQVPPMVTRGDSVELPRSGVSDAATSATAFSSPAEAASGSPSAELGRSGFDIEGYITGLQWSPEATEHEKTLVAGNLRRLFGVLREKHNAYVMMARDVAKGFDQFDKLFDQWLRDGHIRIEGNKVILNRSATTERGD